MMSNIQDITNAVETAASQVSDLDLTEVGTRLSTAIQAVDAASGQDTRMREAGAILRDAHGSVIKAVGLLATGDKELREYAYVITGADAAEVDLEPPVPTPAERVFDMFASPNVPLGAARSKLRLEIETLKAEVVTYRDSPRATDCEMTYAGHERLYLETIRDLRVSMGKDPDSSPERTSAFNESEGTDVSWHMYSVAAPDGQAVPMVSCVMLTMKDGRPYRTNGRSPVEVRAYPLQTASAEYLHSLPPLLPQASEASPEEASVIRFYGPMQHNIAFSNDMRKSDIDSPDVQIMPFDVIVSEVTAAITADARDKVVRQLVGEYMALPGPLNDAGFRSFVDTYENAPASLLTHRGTDPDGVRMALHDAFSQGSIEKLSELLERPMDRLEDVFEHHGMRERYEWLLRRAPDVFRQVQAAERQAMLEQFEGQFTQRLRDDEKKIELLGALAQGLRETQNITQYLSSPQSLKKKRK